MMLLTYDPIGDLSQVPRPLSAGCASLAKIRVGDNLVRIGQLRATTLLYDHGWAVCIEDFSTRHTVKRLFHRDQALALRDKLEQIIDAAVDMAGADHV